MLLVAGHAPVGIFATFVMALGPPHEHCTDGISPVLFGGCCVLVWYWTGLLGSGQIHGCH